MNRCPACETSFAAVGWRCPACGHQPVLNGYVSFAPELAASDAHFEPTAFAQLEAVESGSFWFRARNAAIVWAVGTYFPNAKSLLEVGCGTGFVLRGVHEALPQIELTGGELSYSGLDVAAHRVPTATLYQMDAQHLPFDNEFDVVGAFDVLEHLDDDGAVLSEFRRTIRPGGGLVLTVPQHRWLWSVADDFGRHRRRYDRRELRRKLLEAGFVPRRMTSLVALLLPVMAASRVRQPKSVEDFDPGSEFRLPASVDRALERVMDLERWAIRRGVSFPAGGTLLAVAEVAA